jgi:curved DNA-binding protein CbpA
MNFYVILGVPATADSATIRSAFRELVRQHHPDAGVGSSAQRFREIVEAYETLSDPERRRLYDASLRPHATPVTIEPLIPTDPEPLVVRVPSRVSRHVDLASGLRRRDVLEWFQAIERLFWEF